MNDDKINQSGMVRAVRTVQMDKDTDTQKRGDTLTEWTAAQGGAGGIKLSRVPTTDACFPRDTPLVPKKNNQ